MASALTAKCVCNCAHRYLVEEADIDKRILTRKESYAQNCNKRGSYVPIASHFFSPLYRRSQSTNEAINKRFLYFLATSRVITCRASIVFFVFVFSKDKKIKRQITESTFFQCPTTVRWELAWPECVFNSGRSTGVERRTRIRKRTVGRDTKNLLFTSAVHYMYTTERSVIARRWMCTYYCTRSFIAEAAAYGAPVANSTRLFLSHRIAHREGGGGVLQLVLARRCCCYIPHLSSVRPSSAFQSLLCAAL